MRWHLVAINKTYLQCKGFQKIPSDNRDTNEKPLNISMDVHVPTCPKT